MGSVLISALAMWVAVWTLDLFVLPKRQGRLRVHTITLFWLTPPTMVFFSLLMLTYRPFFSCFVTVAIYATVVILNNAKVKALKEPLVYSDFSLFKEVVRHPHLYVKYIGAHNVALISLLIVVAVIGGFGFEEPFILRTRLEDFFPTVFFFIAMTGALYLIIYGPLRKPFRAILMGFGATADVSANVSQLGLVVCLIFYFFLSGADKIEKDKGPAVYGAGGDPQPGDRALFHIAAETHGGKPPTIVAIQAESFFDMRYLGDYFAADVLAGYDSAVADSVYYGRLSVPAWGAYTMRTEFAFLSGLPEPALGHHRYNPYLQLGRRPFWTVAHTLKALGYRTVCIHPFAATFFNRKEVFPNLGFDEFIDESAFDRADYFGPYVSDLALGRKVTDIIGDSDRPLFIFAITMENHGAWSKNRLKDHTADSMTAGDWPLGSYSLGHYATHMQHTDQMIRHVTEYLASRDEPGVLCLYGDHMPNLQRAFKQVGYDDPRTDYFIWRSDGRRHRQLNAGADGLSRLMLDAALNDRTDRHPDEDTDAEIPIIAPDRTEMK